MIFQCLHWTLLGRPSEDHKLSLWSAAQQPKQTPLECFRCAGGISCGA